MEVYKKVQETTLATVSQLVFLDFNVLSIAQRCLRTNHIIIRACVRVCVRACARARVCGCVWVVALWVLE